jgi:hypothetical protein
MLLRPIVVNRDSHGDTPRKAAIQFEQRQLQALHGLHGVGQDQDAEARPQRVLHHRQDVRVHEGLAAGEADFLQLRMRGDRFVDESPSFLASQVDQPVVARR